MFILDTGRSTSVKTSRLEDTNGMFNFSGKKEPSAFLKFVEDGIPMEKSLQRVRCCTYEVMTSRRVSERLNDVQ